jgi:glycosyltransferase involved in cell wall biosynthesis
VRFVPFQESPAALAQYYQAADVCLHAARADTFPTTVLESLACGTPVVASAVGGIPEQVRSLTSLHGLGRAADAGEATGALVAPGDAEGMGRVVADLLTRADLRARLAGNAVRDARQRFGLDRQRDAYLEWYDELLERRASRTGRAIGVAGAEAMPR